MNIGLPAANAGGAGQGEGEARAAGQSTYHS